MKVIRLPRPAEVAWPRPTVAIGNFDGVHLGHQALLRVTVEDVRRAGGTALALGFDPHPARVVAPERAPLALTTLEQRAELLGELGVDAFAVLPFDARVAALSPEAFAREVLVGLLAAERVVVGAGFRFGRGRAGDTPLLVELGQALGFAVHEVGPVSDAEGPISSSRIRAALQKGDVEAAARLLGRLPFVDGSVVRGEGRGRTIGVPTANLSVRNECLPARGVYACLVRAESRQHAAVVNIGERPTFGGAGTTVEAHLLGFAGDLYGQPLRVRFVKQLREERRFAGAPELVAQIERDVAEARRVLEGLS